MRARLVLCFDGTWNKPDEENRPDQQVETNVRRFYEAVRGQAPDGTRQIKWYGAGVGTRWDQRFRGGAFGYGIDEVIRSGYEFLVSNHVDDDEIFIVGFSRGAYAARSLVGMLRKAGLVHDIDDVGVAYELYRKRDASPDSPEAVAFRDARSRRVEVRFVGVWDTVGSLGIPGSIFGNFNRVEYGFHDTALSRIVKNAFHAVAIDEHRPDYEATLWSGPFPPGQTVEQRWFAGAHCDIGGGYVERELSDLALDWMIDKAAGCGLALSPAERPKLTAASALGRVHDSFEKFLFGLYDFFKDPYYRPIKLGGHDNQVISPSARQRFDGDTTYRPKNPGFPS
jgi:uncharacterized protein (DUF2235 family)